MNPERTEDLELYLESRSLWRADPERYARDRLGMSSTWQQRQVFEAIRDPGAKVSVRSGHGTGKTGATAAILWWFLECFEYSKIPCTAPTSHQLRDVLWAEIAKWERRSDALFSQYHVTPALRLSQLFSRTNERVQDASAKTEWFAVARTSGRENPDALQGFHATDLTISADGRAIETDAGGSDEGKILFIIDEASGVHDTVFEVAEGALSSAGARLLMLGNPTRTTGYFADSHHRARGQYRTLHFRSDQSPLVDPGYRQRLVQRYGEGSNVVRVRADGEFPSQDDDVLISLEWTEPAIDRDLYADEKADIRVGVDVARFGDDRTAIIVRQGRNLRYCEIGSKQSTMVTAGKAIAVRKRFKANRIYVDSIGVGAGVCDRMRELGENVVEVNVAAAAPVRRKNEDDAQGHLLRDHLWLEMADWLRNDLPSFAGLSREIADDLSGELATTKFGFDSSGRIQVESKDQMKKRLKRSPDIADALGVTFAPFGGAPSLASSGRRKFR